jgi:hypothetical protein
METIEQLLTWCAAEQEKLMMRLAELAAENGPAVAAEIEATRKHLNDLSYVMERLKS